MQALGRKEEDWEKQPKGDGMNRRLVGRGKGKLGREFPYSKFSKGVIRYDL